MMHVYGGNLVVFVGCVVVDSFGGVAAGGVERVLKAVVTGAGTAPVLRHRAKNMEALADALGL